MTGRIVKGLKAMTIPTSVRRADCQQRCHGSYVCELVRFQAQHSHGQCPQVGLAVQVVGPHPAKNACNMINQ